MVKKNLCALMGILFIFTGCAKAVRPDFKPLFDTYDVIIKQWDADSNQYDEVLKAIDSYGTPNDEKTYAALGDVFSDALAYYDTTLVPVYEKDEAIESLMDSQHISRADFYATYDQTASQRLEYIYNIEFLETCLFLAQAGGGTELYLETCRMYSNIHEQYKNIAFLGVNHLFVDILDKDLDYFKTQTINNLLSLTDGQIPWEKDKDTIALKTEICFQAYELAIDQYVNFLSEQQDLLNRMQAEAKN